MSYSLQLIADRLNGRGHHAEVIGDASVRVNGVRVLSTSGKVSSIGALQVYPEQLLEAARHAEMGESAEAGQPPETGRLADRIAAHSCRALAILRRARIKCPESTPEVPLLVVDGVSDEADLLNLLTTVIEELDAALQEAGELAWNEGGLAVIVDRLSKLVSNPVYVVDSSFKVVAITDDPDMEEMSVNWMHAARHGYLSYDLIMNLIRSNELHDIESSKSAAIVNSDYFYVPFVNYNLRQGGKVQGHLFVVQMYKTISDCDLELVDLMAPHVLHAVQSDPWYKTRRGPLYEHFIVDWLEGGLDHDSDYVKRQLEALSLSAGSRSIVAILRLTVAGEFRREHLARLLEDRQGCRAVSHEDQVIALFQVKRRNELDAVLKKVRSICRSQKCEAAVSDVQETLLHSPRAYRQARKALELAELMHLDDDVVCYGDVAAYQPCLGFSTQAEADTFCHPAVATLREYDQTHAVKLLPTLSAFLKNERDVQATADELFVHRNTLTYRMRKIQDLCSFDLDDFGTRHWLLESILLEEHREKMAQRFRNGK